jgi:hypothetical protein
MGGGSMSTRLSLSSPAFVSAASGGGGGTPDITGTVTIASGFGGFGYSPGSPGQFIPSWGSRTSDPSGIITSFFYNTSNIETMIQFTTGTYTGANGTLDVTNSATINGSTSYLVKLGSITQTLTPNGSSWIRIIGDPFSMEAQTGSTLNFQITLM